ncbi:MAG TPA: pyridoxamine 5'-phosphate oxidase family protein, partial [Acidimicrobiia bacterium]|nr:pyridoxamine 5'-phosphate oxidase family protein [Acidimicrobiia bacterium]
FEMEAPELADKARLTIEKYRFVFLGTVRPDGSPRISPVEAHLVNGQLMLALIPRTRKASDIQRDRRIALQSPITDPGNPGRELKIFGRASLQRSEQQQRTAADHIEEASGWRPETTWLFTAVEMSSVTVIEWEQGEMLLNRWTSKDGVLPAERRHLDMTKGAYLPAASDRDQA